MSKQLVWHQADCEPSGNRGDCTRITLLNYHRTGSKRHSVSNVAERSGNKCSIISNHQTSQCRSQHFQIKTQTQVRDTSFGGCCGKQNKSQGRVEDRHNNTLGLFFAQTFLFYDGQVELQKVFLTKCYCHINK